MRVERRANTVKRACLPLLRKEGEEWKQMLDSDGRSRSVVCFRGEETRASGGSVVSLSGRQGLDVRWLSS